MLMETKYTQQLNSVFCSTLESSAGAKGRVSLGCFNTQRIHKHFQLFKRLQLLMEPVATEENVFK